MFGYSYPNTGINQSELANESRYFINDILTGKDTIFLHVKILIQ